MAGESDPEVAISINGVPIRLTAERWQHITNRHHEMAASRENCLLTVREPDVLLRGDGGALIALRPVGNRRYLAVVFRELSADDGFVLTSYFTRRVDRSEIVWQRRT